MNLEQKEALITNLERTIMAQNDEVSNMKKMIKENRSTIEKFKSENMQMNTKYSELHAHCEGLQDTLTSSEKDVEKLRSQLYELDEELTYEKKTNAEQKAQIIDYKNTISKDKDLIDNGRNIIKDLEAQNNEMTNKVNSLTESNEKLKNDKVDLQGQITNMSYEIKICNMSTETEKANNENSRKTFEDLNNDINRLRSEIENKNSSIQKLDIEKNNLNFDIKVLTGEKSNLENHLSDTKESYVE